MAITYAGDIIYDRSQPIEERTGEKRKYRVYLADDVNPAVRKRLHERQDIVLTELGFDVENGEGDEHRFIEIVDDVRDAQSVVIRSSFSFKEEDDFEGQAPNLEQIIRMGVGTDNVDMKEAGLNGVLDVQCTPGSSTDAVAERVLMFALYGAAKVARATKSLREKKWGKSDKTLKPERLLAKKIGVFGLGRIGRRFAEMLKNNHGVKEIFYCDRETITTRDYPQLKGLKLTKVDLPTLMSTCDVISNHVGGDREIITAELLSTVKQGAQLINCGRGDVVSTKGVAEAQLSKGLVFAADVYQAPEGEDEEGKRFKEKHAPKDDITHQVVSDDNFVGTPHTAASDDVTQEALAVEAADAVFDFATTGVINPSKIPGMALSEIGKDKLPDVEALRMVMTHASVKGALGTITTLAGELDMNLSNFANDHGLVIKSNGADTKMAGTFFDVEGASSDQAMKLLANINKRMKIFGFRVLQFLNVE